MFGGPRLYVVGVTAERWARRYCIERFTAPCSECGEPCTVSLPFAQGPFRGLQAEPCRCGNTRTPYGVVRVKGDLFDPV